MSQVPPNPAGHDSAPLTGRKVLLAVTGGIAAYKSAALTSRLAQAGAEVRVIMTEAATRFVTPLTFESLSGHTVITSIWQREQELAAQHISLARWCDLFLVAPASADHIAKLAAGLCDDIVLLTACALPRAPKTTPALLAPAMNADMWQNPITQRNLATVRQFLGWHLVGPETGWQACRTAGPGRMAEPETIFAAAVDLLL